MTDDYQAVKARIDIVSEIQNRTGLVAKRAGRGFNLAECPFCGGHNCFRIDPDKQLFNCFQCGNNSGGDIVTFVEKFKGCSKNEAFKDLAEACGYKLTRNPADNDSGKASNNEEDTVANIHEIAAEYYHKNLLSTKSPLRHQTKIRKHSLETLKTFNVGFTNGKLHKELQRQGFGRDQILASGLAKEKDGNLHDFFATGLYIYPHPNPSGSAGHFTIKDPHKRLRYQLPNEFKDPECLFYNMGVFGNSKILLTEGENDVLSVLGRGAYPDVVACCGQLSKEQIEYLVKWAPGKTIYLCFDNDEAGRKYQSLITDALKERCLPAKLALILNIERVNLKIVRYNEQCKDIDELLRKERRTKHVLSSLLERSEPYLMPLKEILAVYRTWCKEQERKANYNEVGEIVFDYFRLKGKFFVDGDICFLFHDPIIYAIGNNTPFKSMLYSVAGLNYANSSAKIVLEVLQARAYEHGEHTTVPGWIHTDRKNNVIFFNLANDRNELVKVSPENVEVVQNGLNPERILLRNSPKMQPLNYIPEVDIKAAMSLLKELVFDNLACDISNRYFILARVFNTLLIQFTKARGLDKFSGSKSSGKTSGASLVTALVYGQDYVTVGSAASDFSEATVSPLTIADNLESDAIRGDKRDFLLVAATGVTKQKRKSGTDSENVYERACTQLIVTAIEPFFEGELIERTNDILFNKKHFNLHYLEATEVESKIIANRDLIWSAFFRILAHDVLPEFSKKRAATLKMLREDYRGHSKSRLNELYSCLYLLCTEILKYIPHPEYINDRFKRERMATAVLEDWLNYQDHQASVIARGTNPILYRLEVLLTEYLSKPDDFESMYHFPVEIAKNHLGELIEVKLIASTRELFFAFESLAKNKGVGCPFKSSSQLGARMGDCMDILEAEGWKFVPRMTATRGMRRHWLIKRFEREGE